MEVDPSTNSPNLELCLGLFYLFSATYHDKMTGVMPKQINNGKINFWCSMVKRVATQIDNTKKFGLDPFEYSFSEKGKKSPYCIFSGNLRVLTSFFEL